MGLLRLVHESTQDINRVNSILTNDCQTTDTAKQPVIFGRIDLQEVLHIIKLKMLRHRKISPISTQGVNIFENTHQVFSLSQEKFSL